MRPFAYKRVANVAEACNAIPPSGASTATTASPWQFLAGGTNVMDYFKLSVWEAEGLVDVNDLQTAHGKIEAGASGLHLGALVRMSEAANHPVILRDYPVLAESLALAASTQIRNMASLGGNVLQRTRCSYFRDITEPACNKRRPGSGCAAIGGNTRTHAVLGTSAACISCYPGDFAQALMALDATITIASRSGSRQMRFADLHTGPDRPERETVLAPGDLILEFFIPAGAHTRRSRYIKIRDRDSYEYGLATAAVALELDAEQRVRTARIALGGVAYRPWRAIAAEQWLTGKVLDEAAAEHAGTMAFEGAVPHGENAYKLKLGPQTVARALLETAGMQVAQ